ncbi:MAG: hypothetical protein WBC51_11710, partial [Vicinamibacterales bacterium]
MDFAFDPNTLVSRPFVACPHCGAQQFGVLIVGPQSYSRRCRACGHRSEMIPLPALLRKVVYIDQFAISNMMKTLNRAHGHHARAAGDPFWRRLFERLDRLVQLQLVICPFSEVHINESVVSPDGAALRVMYERLSLMVGFEFGSVIAERQLRMALDAWLENRTPHHDSTPDTGTRGGLQEWKEFPLISARSVYPDEVVAGIRAFRDGVKAKVEALFDDFARETRAEPFDRWLRHERAIGGRAVLEAAQLYARRLQEIEAGRASRLYNSLGWKYYALIAERVGREGLTEREFATKVATFLVS